MSFKNTTGHERSQTQEYILDYLYQSQEQIKLDPSDREEISKCLGPGLRGDEGLIAKLQNGILREMDLIYIPTEMLVIGICICQYSSNCTPKRSAFYCLCTIPQ